MKSEWFRTFHRKYLYITTGCLCALVILASVFLKVNEDVMYDMTDYMGTFLLSIVTTGLSMGYYLTMIVADMIFSDEYKHQTLKNTVSYGISRVKIYLGKLISGLMAGVLVMTVTVAAVSYTHLDVYKRHTLMCLRGLIPRTPLTGASGYGNLSRWWRRCTGRACPW